jgi:hypothetical protein
VETKNILASSDFAVQSHHMETNWAEENLKIIRTLMERSAVYRRALAPIMIFCGSIGIIGGFLGWHWEIISLRGFGLFWSGVAAVALAGSFLLVRRQALKDSEPFWSPPTRRVAQALLPAFFTGFVLTATCVVWGGNDYEPLNQVSLAIAWTWMFGCAIHSAGFFMPRGIKWFGWIFIGSGVVLLGDIADMIHPLRHIPSHLLVGGIFGGLHLAYGVYLYFTEPRGTTS